MAEKYLDDDSNDEKHQKSSSHLPFKIEPNGSTLFDPPFAYDISNLFTDSNLSNDLESIDDSRQSSPVENGGEAASDSLKTSATSRLKAAMPPALIKPSFNQIYKVNDNNKRILIDDDNNSNVNNNNVMFSCSRFKKPRFSQTEHSILDILDTKRSLHLKPFEDCVVVDDDIDFDDTSSFPEMQSTIFSPEKVSMNKHQINRLVGADVSRFMNTILSVDSAFLKRNRNDEGKISDSIAQNYDWFNASKPSPIQPTYVSFNQYQTTFTPLIIYDSWAQAVEEYSSNPNPTQFELSGKCRRSETDENITLRLSAIMPMAPKFESVFFRYWLAVVKSGDFAGREFFGYICESARAIAGVPMSFTIMFSKSNTKNHVLLTKLKLHTVELVYYLKPAIRLIETISQIETRSNFFRQILEPTHDVCGFATSQGDFQFPVGSVFNESQRKAIVGSYNAIQEPFANIKIHMIQGPPGTGKTHTLVGIVKGIFANSRLSQLKPLRLLICAASNGAIDEIGRRLILCRNFLEPIHGRPLMIVRLGQGSQVSDEVRPFLLDTMVDQAISRRIYDGQRKSRESIKSAIVDNADIIISTLASCHSPALDNFRTPNSEHAFRCLIVDEASQCSEPELLMPLIYHINKVILIGDHLQLPATIISQRASKLNYGRSLFERFYDHFSKTSDVNNPQSERAFPVITLSEQFRMHPEICQFPSDQFYFGKLSTVSGTGENELVPLRPYFVFDIIDSKEQTTEVVEEGKDGNPEIRHSKFNEIEADFIFKLLWQIFVKLGCMIVGGGEEFDDKMDPKDWPEPNQSQTLTNGNANGGNVTEDEDNDEGGSDDEEEDNDKENRLDDDSTSAKSKDKKKSKKKKNKKKKNKKPHIKFPKDFSITVGVITFYRGQKSAITRRLKDFYNGALLNHVEVNTVDAFQGQERDIIVLSCVRAFDPSLRGSTVGFVRSKQRMNVALTRAKSALFVCISGKSFIDVPRWQELLANAQKRKCITRVTSQITDEKLATIIESK